jgi:hypothetical protein
METPMNQSPDRGARRSTGSEERPWGLRSIVYLTHGKAIHPGKAALAKSVVVLLAALGTVRLSAGQDDHKKKVPVLDKITTAPNGQNEFNGKVQSLDLKNEVLNVESLHEDDTEIFPIKKTVTVASASGYRVDISVLKPGTNILVYFEQRGDKRKIKEIVVLGTAPAAATKAAVTPPS